VNDKGLTADEVSSWSRLIRMGSKYRARFDTCSSHGGGV